MNIFEEQAEHLDYPQFKEWTVEHPKFRDVIWKLTGPGNKLVSGPRGCGKSTLLLFADSIICEDGSDSSVSAYVNFKHSLKLEPLVNRASDSIYWFRQWVLFNLLNGFILGLRKKGMAVPVFLEPHSAVGDKIIAELSVGRLPKSIENDNALSGESFKELIHRTCDELALKKVVFLLDDAAHAFSKEQQREFFEIFRILKSSVICSKAAVYPGVTEYSPNFHLGHDAQEVNVWFRPEDPDYLEFMVSVLEARLPPELFNAISSKPDLLHLLCFASFGIPRALIYMTSRIIGEKDEGADPTEAAGSIKAISRQEVFSAIQEWNENTVKVFSSLKQKLPRYKNFIDAGETAYNVILSLLKEYNQSKDIGSKSVIIAIPNPLPSEVKRIVGFLQYAGLISYRESISKGEKGDFQRFLVHYASVIDANALALGRAKVPLVINAAFQRRSSSEFTRSNVERIFGSDLHDRCKLDLPPCEYCSTPRYNEDAKFCMNCGRPLRVASAYEEIGRSPISQLPLSARRVARIQEHSTIRSVLDIFLDHERKELRKVPRIGPYWANKIYQYAEEYLLT